MKRKLTPEQRAERAERRAEVRATVAAKVDELRKWRDARAAVATLRARKRRKAQLCQPRGVDPRGGVRGRQDDADAEQCPDTEISAGRAVAYQSVAGMLQRAIEGEPGALQAVPAEAVGEWIG